MNKILLFSIGILLSTISSAQRLTLVKDIMSGPGHSRPELLSTLPNGDLLFTADDGVHGRELWRSDGTANGTALLKDIYPGAQGSTILYKGVVLNGQYYFLCNDIIHGYELWVTDGTANGTHIVKDINPGKDNGASDAVIVYNGKVYFLGNDGITGNELWVTDGTNNGTHMVKNISLSKYTHNPSVETGSSPRSFTIAYGKLYFVAWTDTHGEELYETDGTANGTKRISDLYPGKHGSFRGELKLFKNKLYFEGISNDNISMELYSFNGTSISLVKDINPTIGEYSGINSGLSQVFMNTTGKLYFKAASSRAIGTNGSIVNNSELWMTDGTTNGTKLVKEIEPGPIASNPQIYASINNKIIFSPILDFGQQDARELWVSDGTANGTKKIVELDSTGVGAFAMKNLYMLGDARNPVSNGIYFFAGKKHHGSEKFTLWGTDGTTSGTFKVDNSPTLHLVEDVLINGKDMWVSIADSSIPSGVELFLFDMTNLPASVNNINSESSFTIYPNPNNGVFSIKLDEEGFAKGYLRVADVTGRIVYDQSIAANQQEVSISKTNLPKGLYHVMVQIDGKKMSQTVSIE